MNLEEEIKKKVSEFFTWINHPIVLNYYVKNIQNWDALCASLHILNDLQRPKSEYYSLKSINYLETIGIMQTLYIEQDSIQTLKNAILEIKGIKFKLNNYDNIRNTRNKVFGHPSDKKTGEIRTRHFFDIQDNTKQIVEHVYWGTIKKIESEEFNIRDLVLGNSKITYAYLQEIEQDFKLKFKGIMEKYAIKLDKNFSNASYVFEKLLTKDNDSVVINMYERSIDHEIEKIKKGLKERNIYTNFERDIQILEFLSHKLKALFYKQTCKDIEFYTYALTLSDNIRKIVEDLKNTDTV